jgi:hypothetical protein
VPAPPPPQNRKERAFFLTIQCSSPSGYTCSRGDWDTRLNGRQIVKTGHFRPGEARIFLNNAVAGSAPPIAGRLRYNPLRH